MRQVFGSFRATLPLLTLFAVGGCARPISSTPIEDPAQIPLQGEFVASWSAILDGASGERLARLCPGATGEKLGGYWTPSAATIQGLEPQLAALLHEKLALTRTHPYMRLVPVDYFRQYGGVILGGKQLICVNGFHRSHFEHGPYPSLHGEYPESWKTEPEWVDDGCQLYFQVLYDAATGQFTEFRFNGCA